MEMKNSSRVDIANNPTFQLLTRLISDCFQQNVTHSQIVPNSNEDTDMYCPRTFDGFSCWDETPAGATAFQTCPKFIIGFDPMRFSYKECLDNGTWFKLHPEANKPWTNYTTCVDMEDLDFRRTVNNIYVSGYSISAVALLVSLVIFLSFRSLQCIRIRIHMHLFSSLTLNNLLWIIWYKTVVNSATVVQENKVWCQIIHIVTQYFMVTSYSWMFCEGLHLHIALVVVFVKENVAMRWFVIVGWGVPLLITSVYTTVRYFTPGATKRCWIEQSDAFWIIAVPVVLSLIASFVFLVNVLRVLLTKLHPAANQRASVATKKALRAAFILTLQRLMCRGLKPLLHNVLEGNHAYVVFCCGIVVPLFGLHFILIPFRPSRGTPGEKWYQVISALLTSLQGVCVAISFCFTNHDVVTAIRTHFARMMNKNDGLPMTGVTGGESMMNTRENIV